MPLEVYVTSSGETKPKTLKLDKYEIPTTLGGEEKALAVQMNDVFKSIASEIGKSLSNESELTIELTGSTSLEVSGGIKYLILNLGGSTSKGNVIKVSLKTKIGKKST